MTHQYVGAYYVPHGWYENYDAGFQYDPLSTVFYKNAWYILKQPAPVGTEPTNSQYWVQYSLVPGQIIGIENQIQNIQDEISEYPQKFEKLEGESETYAAVLKAMNGNKNYIKVAMVGDSYGVLGTKPWTRYVLDYVPGYNGCVNEGTFLPGTTKTYFEQLQSIPNLGSFTHVVICAGTNDKNTPNIATNPGVFDAPGKEIVDYARSKNPFMKIMIGMNMGTTVVTNLQKEANIMRAYTHTAYVNGMELINFHGILNNQNLLESDLIHPNQLGSKYLGEIVLQALYGSVPYFNYTFNVGYTPSSIVESITNNMVVTHTPSSKRIRFDNTNFVFKEPQNLGFGVNLGTITKGLVYKRQLQPVTSHTPNNNILSSILLHEDGAIMAFLMTQISGARNYSISFADMILENPY